MNTPLEQAMQRLSQSLPGWFGFEIDELEHGRAVARMPIESRMLAPNGYLHAASIILLADSACGFGCLASLPGAAKNFTTMELKSNFLGTARDGTVSCEASLIHGGRSTQIWDAEVFAATVNRPIALFRCTQMLLYPDA